MATGVGPPEVQSDQGTRELGINDLKVVFDALVPVSVKYEFFGIQIGFEMSEIDGIRRQFADSRQCLLRILRIRLGKTPALTWKDIDTALRSKSVNESGLANDIQKEYGHLFIHEQTFESQEDGKKGSEKKSTKKGKCVGDDRPQQVGKERQTEEVSESEGFRKSSETPRTDNKSTKTQRKVKNQKKPLEPEKDSERERKQRGDKKKHADISPISESKVVKKGSRQKYKEISEQRAPKEVQMKYESEPSSGKYESKVIHKSKHTRKDSERRSQKCSEKKQVLLISESISSSEEEIVKSKCESKVIHKSEEQLRKKSESESSVSSSEEEMEEVDESETAEKYYSKQEIDSDHQEVRKSDNISTKTQRRVKKAKKHSEPEQGNAKRERKAQMKQQARHGVKIESDVRHKDSHTGTCKVQIAPKEVQSKSESEYSVSSSEEEMEEVGESETPEEYSSEQEQYSDKEEVSEDPTTSESEVTKETKGFVCPATEKQKKVINQQYIQTSDIGDRRKSGAQKRKSRKKQRAESEIRCNEIVTSSSHYGGKASQTVEKTNPSKQIQSKEDERRETKTYKFKQRSQITEEFSDEEVREKPATKSAKRKEHKKLKTKETSSTNAGKERNEDEKVARIKIIKTEYHLKTKEKVSLSPDAHVKEQKEKDKRKVHKQANETNEGKDLKADSRQELATRRKAKNILPSDVTEEDSEGEEEWYSAESSEEENRDTEQNVSVEEEETEPSDDGITSSEEEVSEEHKPYTKEKVKETKRKVTRKEMEKRVKLNVPHLPGDNDPGERSEDQGEHGIKPKKRRRRRHRESSPIARGSSSPSTSQEEQQVKKRKSKRENDRERRKKREMISSSLATDYSSPESEMLRNLTESEIKALVKVFKRFFGRLCCAIKYPVETAAQLQAKHLISRSTMENIIKSPESQQVKAITLVRALDRKVKLRPDKIFTVTKVFLENEILQNVGRQLWTETGILAMNLLQLYDICSLFFSQERFVVTGQPQCLAMSCLLQRDN